MCRRNEAVARPRGLCRTLAPTCELASAFVMQFLQRGTSNTTPGVRQQRPHLLAQPFSCASKRSTAQNAAHAGTFSATLNLGNPSISANQFRCFIGIEKYRLGSMWLEG